MNTLIFVVDGPDGVGKTTLIRQLVNYFSTSTSYLAKALSPSNNCYGKGIKALLNDPDIVARGGLPKQLETQLQLSSLVYLDMVEIPEMIKTVETTLHDAQRNERTLLLFVDRWVDSSGVYQYYLKHQTDTPLYQGEYQPRYIPEKIFILDAPDELLSKRIDDRQEEKDIYESETTQKRVREGYRKLFELQDKYHALREQVTVDNSLDENVKLLIGKIISVLK